MATTTNFNFRREQNGCSTTFTQSPVVENCLRLLNLENYRHPFLDHCAKKLLSGKAILIFVEAFLHQRLSLWNAQENLRVKDVLQKLIELEDISESAMYRKLEKLPIGLLQELRKSFRLD
ncbi:hypothetical protein [Siminovitchia sp. 179-K 8D1 HS]|uniref:hypothetical protein n=1 Tax=Siminovitchia sp. 179-K 8D1 HS TaxID=3142385 RepID=UPI0039A2957B